jgi:cell division septal protein FtsQ
MTVCEWQALMVPMDIGNRSAILPSLGMHLLWMIISISLLSFITVLLPYAIFFYQSDPEATIISRILRSLCYLFCTVLICSLAFVISYLFLKFVDLPYTELSVDVSE